MTKRDVYTLAIGIVGFLLFFAFESLIISFLMNDEMSLLRRLYPSLQEKLDTIGIAGLSSICKQLKYRWLLLIGFFYFLVHFSKTSNFSSLGKNVVGWRIRLFYVVQLVFLPDLLQELRFRGQWKVFFQPLAQFSFIEQTFPFEYYIQLTGILLFGASAILVLVKWKDNDYWPLVVSVLIFIGWTYLLSLFFGFGKIDHTYASLFAGIMGMVVCRVYILQNSDEAAQGYRIFQAFIWSCYFFSGLEKLIMSGFDWFQAAHFEAICKFHSTDVCHKICEYSPVGSLILLSGLVFQLVSPLQWRFQKWGYVNVSFGILFHLGTWFLFDIGGWQSPWIIMLLFLWPMKADVDSKDLS